jgi:regulator of replication initiation timing
MSQQLDSKTEKIRNLERRINVSPPRPSPAMEDELHCLRHETDTLKLENNMLRDKVHDLTAELEQRVRDRTPDRAVESENRHLKAELADKQREN